MDDGVSKTTSQGCRTQAKPEQSNPTTTTATANSRISLVQVFPTSLTLLGRLPQPVYSPRWQSPLIEHPTVSSSILFNADPIDAAPLRDRIRRESCLSEQKSIIWERKARKGKVGRQEGKEKIKD
jgi:hypothetical protein